MRSLILCRVVSESRSVVRKRKVIVDSLRTMDVGDRIVLCSEELGDPVGGRSCIIASDSHEKLDVIFLEEIEIEILLEILVGRFEPAHLEV